MHLALWFVTTVAGGILGGLIISVVIQYFRFRTHIALLNRAAETRKEIANLVNKYYNIAPNKSAEILEFRNTKKNVEES